MDVITSIPTPYSVITEVYEGPLDLLLQLIERAELDITKLALAEVTNQYLEYLHNFPYIIAADVSSFLVIAAKLIQIKSEVLLPRPPAREPGEEDLGDSLVQQLIIYKQFRKIAEFLMERNRNGWHSYPRQSSPVKVETKLDPDSISLNNLLEIAKILFSQKIPDSSLNSLITPPRTTIREKIILINNFLRVHRKGTFQDLILPSYRRIEIVITFLAILELIKRQMIYAQQERIFGQIEIEVSAPLQDDPYFELEFGE